VLCTQEPICTLRAASAFACVQEREKEREKERERRRERDRVEVVDVFYQALDELADGPLLRERERDERERERERGERECV
jgi:hypothetical protein